MSSSSKPPFRNVPPPTGAKATSAYARFIPREELHDFEAWSPHAFNGAPGEPDSTAEPAEPTGAEWQAQVTAARSAGYQDGYRDGMVALEGFKQSFASQMSVQVGHLLQSLDQQFQALEVQMAEAVTATAVSLARQVLRTELTGRPDLVAHVAAEAVGAVLASARQITLKVHPQDLPLVAEGAGEALQARGARVVADPTLARGGCRVESDLGAVDARIAERWQQAASTLGSALPWADEGDAE